MTDQTTPADAPADDNNDDELITLPSVMDARGEMPEPLTVRGREIADQYNETLWRRHP